MRTIELDVQSFIASPEEKKFILLRSEKADDVTFLTGFAVPKIKNRDNANKIPGVWGTLGYQDNSPIDWTGKLECSNEGNNDFIEGSTVKEEVDLIKQMYPDLRLNSEIKEKVINLNQLEIPLPEVFSLDEIPRLRLDIFLGKDEGALAFYQLNQENNQDAELEFILPQATVDHKTDNRDRLKYFFNMIPTKSIEEVEDIPGRYKLSSKINEKDFIVKVLIFKRTFTTKKTKSKVPASSTEVVRLVEEKLAAYPDGLLVKDHILKIFNTTKNNFVRAQPGSIHQAKKTLLLLHGTFASTKGSFKEVYSWIGTLIGDGKYEQVIAFDHPTLFYDAEMNINVFFEKLKAVGLEKFDKEVDLIGTSQGGLLAQYLANMKQDSIKVGKVALVASANGVDYLTFGQNVATGLKLFRKVMMKLGYAPVALISALFQHSIDWVINQPGLAVMKPGDQRLIDIIYQKPNLSKTRYLPVAGNYHATGGFKRKLELGIDAILDEENDWVVGTKNQFKAPGEYVAMEEYNPGKFREFMISDAIHGSLIEKDEAQDMIEHFFFHTDIDSIDKKHKNMLDRFDAHLHLFGRNVITGRIILMLLGDLFDYFKQDDPSEKLDPISLREEDDSGSKLSKVIRNIFKYFLFNKGAHQMLHDIEEEYYEVKSGTYRYVPLMFDLEMTFRNHYEENNALEVISKYMDDFKEEHDKFLERISNTVDQFEKKGEKVFKGSKVQNEESVKLLKYAKTIIKGLKLIEENVSGDAKDSFEKQLEEMRQLKVIYGADIFPFLATDPRRTNMGGYIEELVGPGKIFHGIKIYTPNGYSPTDPHLFNPDVSFVGGTCLYQWCVDHDIAIMAHNSDAGFATFTDRLQVNGDVCTQDPGDDCTYKLEYMDKKYIDFEYNLKKGGFGKAVQERARRLNHPCIWKKVLTRYPDLKICFAHFGGGSEKWQDEIADLVMKFDHVYTDLSCQTNLEMLEKISKKYFKKNSADNAKMQKRIMYGSDYFLNMLQGIEFENYYKHFEEVFSNDQLKYMSMDVPRSFLGV